MGFDSLLLESLLVIISIGRCYYGNLDILCVFGGLIGVRSDFYFKLRTSVPTGLTGVWLVILGVVSLHVPISSSAGRILGQSFVHCTFRFHLRLGVY